MCRYAYIMRNLLEDLNCTHDKKSHQWMASIAKGSWSNILRFMFDYVLYHFSLVLENRKKLKYFITPNNRDSRLKCYKL